ncbi:caspase family protein [Sphingomonas sp. BK580]|uniref:caspase family protein n=1 Tax=Sphingomonas sp. BK580 TaxID=2586972 RepID=UPI00288AA7D5|nr:caspase family protein [Sphingomonas sp. BK580]
MFEDKSVAGPATHVLIVGVGDYPHLPGGASEVKARFDDGMKQLSSPPASARAFADWVISHLSSPVRPLATVELLLSEPNLAYSPPARGGRKAPDAVAGPAAVQAISDAALRWKARGDAEPGSLLIFYFCGHGFSKGTDFALVASDFGGNAGLPMLGLIDLPRFLAGMIDCGSTDQCYFIDACRTATGSLIEMNNYQGNTLVQKLGAVTPGVAQCVYYSTLGGTRAHGRKGRPSFFTQALLKALAGVAASNDDGDWRVKTARLFEALAHLMLNFPAPGRKVQSPQSGSQVQFELHRIQGDPELPFLVGFAEHAGPRPPSAISSILFRQAGADVSAYPATVPPLPRPCDWRPDVFETWLSAGETEMVLSRADGDVAIERHSLQPPGKTLKGK